MNKLFATVLIALVLAGCATSSRQQALEKPPKHAGRVKVLMYDPSPRLKPDRCEVFDAMHSIQKPFREIALLTCEGSVDEEAVMTEAIIYRARTMGADAVIILEPNNYQEGR